MCGSNRGQLAAGGGATRGSRLPAVGVGARRVFVGCVSLEASVRNHCSPHHQF